MATEEEQTLDGRGLTSGVPVEEHGQVGVVGEVVDVLTELEAAHHAAGWDNNPPVVLYFVGRRTSRIFEVGVYPCGGVGDMHPRNELAAVAGLMENQPALMGGLTRGIMPPVPIIACAVVMEAWGIWLEGHQRPDRMIADIPGAREMRLALGLIGRHTLRVHRVRDCPVRFDTWRSGQVPSDEGGIHHSLTRIHRASREVFWHATAGATPL
jgi:hypothetical protein